VANRQSTLFEEAVRALGGTWRLLLGRSDALSRFDFSQRGLAGSFIPLVLAFVAFVVFMGLGSGQGPTVSGAGLLFICGALVSARFVALRLVLPRLDAQHGFRPALVASNWSNAIVLAALLIATVVGAFVGALVLGPDAGAVLVDIVLVAWAALAIAAFTVEVNILRLAVGLRGGEVFMVLAAQVFALILAVFILAQLPLR
jgi:hypothetical protein